MQNSTETASIMAIHKTQYKAGSDLLANGASSLTNLDGGGVVFRKPHSIRMGARATMANASRQLPAANTNQPTSKGAMLEKKDDTTLASDKAMALCSPYWSDRADGTTARINDPTLPISSEAPMVTTGVVPATSRKALRLIPNAPIQSERLRPTFSIRICPKN